MENLRKTLGAEFRGQAALEQRIKEICQTRVRYGYRRCAVKAGLSGQNKTSRIYRELGLQLRNKMPKRRVKAKLTLRSKVACAPSGAHRIMDILK